MRTPSESNLVCGPQELQQLFVCDKYRRGADAPSELLEEYPQTFIIQSSRRLDDLGHLHFVPWFHDTGNELGEIRG